MNKKSTAWVVLLILVILVLIGGIYLWQKNTTTQQITTVEQAGDETSSPLLDRPINISKADNEAMVVKDEDCLIEPHVKSYSGLGGNGKPSADEYIVPINCSESLLFKREGAGEIEHELSGTFNVYYQEGDSAKYLFKHRGLLMDIAGDSLWDVTEKGDVVHISLLFRDSFFVMPWDYYISRSNKELLVGLTGGLDVHVGDNNKYELRLDTTPNICRSESDTRITKSITYSGKTYSLPNAIEESCAGNLNDPFPLPRITVSNVDVDGNKVTLNVPQNEGVVFDYNKGEFVE